MTNEQKILGTGWSFPPAFEAGGRNGLIMSSGVQDINESLEILLSTSLGERIVQPKFGADLSRLVFEPLNATLVTLVKDIIETAILIYEPRINLDKIEILPVQAEGLLNISLDYTVRSVNSRFNYVFPFYVDEANIGNQ